MSLLQYLQPEKNTVIDKKSVIWVYHFYHVMIKYKPFSFIGTTCLASFALSCLSRMCSYRNVRAMITSALQPPNNVIIDMDFIYDKLFNFIINVKK